MAKVRVPVTAGVLLALAAVAGCSSEGSPKAVGPTEAVSFAPTFKVTATDFPTRYPILPAPTPTLTAPVVDPSIVLGGSLRAYLPTEETVPSGWTLKSKYGPSTPSDSGKQVLSATTGLGPTAPCSVMNNLTVLDGYAAYARQDMRSTDGDHAAVVTVASFRAGDAAKQLGVIRDFAARCPSFTEKGTGQGHSDVEIRLVAKPVAGLGDEALDFKMLPEGGYLGTETILVRVGDRVLELLVNSGKSGEFPDAVSLARELAKPVK